jgi:hypothetical protein
MQMEKENTGRWWDYYYVRYFVGSIIGAGMVALLVFKAPGLAILRDFLGAHFSQPEKGVNAEVLTGLATGGLAYCYIASAPILVMHALRARLSADQLQINWIRKIVALITLLACIGLVLAASTDSVILESRIHRTSDVIFWCPFLLVLLVEIAMLFLTNADTTKQAYRILTIARGNADKPMSEYTESYRHLREHGNAFYIIFMEGALTLTLLKVPNLFCFVGALVVWVLPCAYIWFLGTWLERQLPKYWP